MRAQLLAVACAAAVVGVATRSAIDAKPSPDPVRRHTVVIGSSVDGRPITATETGDADNPSKTLVVGCIHGNECAGVSVATRLARATPQTEADLWVLPDLNPDGAAAGTRGNARGVDLNRNFPYAWRHLGGSGYLNSGPRPLSEPESRAVHRFLLRVKPRLAVWFHQPLAVVDDSQGSRRLERSFGRLTGLPLRRLTDYPGSITNWENHHFPRWTAFVTELPPGPLAQTRAARDANAILTISRP